MIPLAGFVAVLFIGLVPFNLHAQSAVSSGFSGAGFTVSGNTGGYGTGFNIEVPAGHNGLTPQLGLSYSNQNRSNWAPYGYGWSLPLGMIQCTGKRGDALIETYGFETFDSRIMRCTLNLFGGGGELIQTGGDLPPFSSTGSS